MTSRAAIIGGGVIGAGWAARFLLMGWDVAIFDPDPEAERKISHVMANARRSLPGLYEHSLPSEGVMRFHRTIVDAVDGAEWIQESCPERLDLKQQILREIQAACPEHAIVASSTSGFPPSQLSAASARPDQIIVAHPFNPVYLLPLVELVGAESTVHRAHKIVSRIGMKPLHVRREIDAHIADRLLEAVWREALWLINDDIATTAEVDDAIRYGFGLRWAQMGLFETYRVAGGEAGMAHFIGQFGPALAWPWTKLTDVPELTDDLVEKIASQSDAQAGEHTIRQLEHIRDDNLVAIMRAMKARDWGVGAHMNAMDTTAKRQINDSGAGPLRTIDRVVPIDWVDYNGHMNESRYGQAFSDAADYVLAAIGAGAAYIEDGNSFFTVEAQTRFLNEAYAGQHIWVDTIVRQAAGKKLVLHHALFGDGVAGPLARCEQTLIHVSLTTRRSCEPGAHVSQGMLQLARQHAHISLDLDR